MAKCPAEKATANTPGCTIRLLDSFQTPSYLLSIRDCRMKIQHRHKKLDDNRVAWQFTFEVYPLGDAFQPLTFASSWLEFNFTVARARGEQPAIFADTDKLDQTEQGDSLPSVATAIQFQIDLLRAGGQESEAVIRDHLRGMFEHEIELALKNGSGR